MYLGEASNNFTLAQDPKDQQGVSRFDFTGKTGQRESDAPATFMDVWEKSRLETERLVNTFAVSQRREEIADQRIEAVRNLTGVELENPYRISFIGAEQAKSTASYAKGTAVDFFKGRLKELAEKYPQFASQIDPRDIEADDVELGRQSALATQRAMETYGPGWSKYIAAFGGGFHGMLSDPVNLASMFIGPTGTGRAGIQGLMRMAFWNAAANAGVEAAFQPFVMQRYRDVGLEYTLNEAAFNVALAGVMGGGLDLAVRGGVRATNYTRGKEPVLDANNKVVGWKKKGDPDPITPEVAQKLQEGDLETVKKVAKDYKLDEDPALRGAIAEAENDEALLRSARESGIEIDDGEGMRKLAQAFRAVEDDAEPPPVLTPRREPEYFDPISNERMTRQDVDAIVDMRDFIAEVNKRPKPRRLVDYLRRELQGLQDDNGDIRNILGRAKDRPGLINKRGARLDDAAQSAWDAGYLPGTSRPTINDLLEAIDEDINGAGRYSVHDGDAVEDIRIAQEMEQDLDELGVASLRNGDDIRAYFARTSDEGAGTSAPDFEDAGDQFDRFARQYTTSSDQAERAANRLREQNPQSSAEARQIVGETLQEGTQEATQRAIFGAHRVSPEITEAQTKLIRELNVAPEVAEALATPGTRGNHFLTTASHAVREGQSAKMAAEALEHRISKTLDEDGLPGLTRQDAEPRGIDELNSEQTRQQIEELEGRVQSDVPSGDRLLFAISAQQAAQRFEQAASVDDLGYYSKAVEAAKGIKQAKGTPEQMLSQLKKAGVKQSEIDATGLEDFLDSFENRADADLTLDKSGSDWVVKLLEDKGYVAGSVSSGRLEIGTAWVDESLRGEGAAVRMYRRLIDEALDDGLAVNSDRQVSGSARRVYDSLERRGYRLEINPNAQEFGERGLNAPPGEPAIAIVAKPKPAQVTRDGIVAFLELQRVPVREATYYSGQIPFEEAGDEVFDNPAKWQSSSLDPSNPTYKETVLHLPVQTEPLTYENFERAFLAKNPTGNPRAAWDRADTKGRQEYLDQLETTFYSGHFDEPNAISHLRTSIQPDADGKSNFVINELQSDWGQRLRDDGARNETKIADLKKARDEALEITRNLAAKHDVSIDSARIIGGRYRSPDGTIFPSDLQSAMRDLELREAELRTADTAVTGHPLVNTTDQWVNTSLRRALRQAVEADADYIAIASGETVDSFGMGAPLEGLKYAYNEMYPKKLRDIIKKLDKDAAKPEQLDKLKAFDNSHDRGEGFVRFPITDKLKKSVMEQGQPLFSINTKALRRQAAEDGMTSMGDPGAKALTPFAAREMPSIQREIDKIVRRLPKGYRLELEDRLVFRDGGRELEAQAHTDPYEQLIKVSLATNDPGRFARHEEIHAYKQLGLFSDEEWNTLTRYAADNDLRTLYKIDGRYKDLYEPRHANNPDKLEEMLVEEMVAEMWADRIGGQSFGGAVNRIIDRIQRFLRRIAEMLGGKGYLRVEDVYQRIESGEIGRRADVRDTMQQPFNNPQEALAYAINNHDKDPITPGLDMSQEARMQRARDMGFDISRTWFNGSAVKPEAFSLDYARKNQEPEWGVDAVWFTEGPKTARWFADRHAEGWNSNRGMFGTYAAGHVSEVYLRPGKQVVIDMADGDNQARMHDLLKQAKKDGADSVLMKNYQDAQEIINGKPKFLDQVAIFDPVNIRDKDAAFDLAREGSSNLMYSFAGERARTADRQSYETEMSAISRMGEVGEVVEACRR